MSFASAFDGREWLVFSRKYKCWYRYSSSVVMHRRDAVSFTRERAEWIVAQCKDDDAVIVPDHSKEMG